MIEPAGVAVLIQTPTKVFGLDVEWYTTTKGVHVTKEGQKHNTCIGLRLEIYEDILLHLSRVCGFHLSNEKIVTTLDILAT